MLKNKRMTSRRAVAPVIATLLLVAIAVVGGSIIFVFSQGFFSSAQISGQPQIESVEIVGYDAGDVSELQLHDGTCSGSGLAAPCVLAAFDGLVNNSIDAEERIAIYVQNQSAQKVTLTEVRVAGTEYTYATAAVLPNEAGSVIGTYYVVLRGDAITPGPAIVSQAIVGELEAGAEATILVDLVGGIQQGRDAQFRIATANGAVFVGTIVASQQSG